jgi:hypothetical protein
MQPITEEKFLSIIPDLFCRDYNGQEEIDWRVICDSLLFVNTELASPELGVTPISLSPYLLVSPYLPLPLSPSPIY